MKLSVWVAFLLVSLSMSTWAQQAKETSNFLASPIDLIAFKKNKGPSNSGIGKPPSQAFRPKAKGFYYRYMLFRTPRQFSEVKRISEFEITVYKFGEEAGDFYDIDEVLISVKSKYKDPDLKHLNLVGQTKDEIRAFLGAARWQKESIHIYHEDINCLILSFADEKVEWFRWIRLKEKYSSFNQLSEELFEWK